MVYTTQQHTTDVRVPLHAFVFGEGDAKEKTLCSVLAVATVNAPHNGEEPTIVDYLVVAKTFQKMAWVGHF